MADLPTGTITFLFTDIEGSTRLREEHRAAMGMALGLPGAAIRPENVSPARASSAWLTSVAYPVPSASGTSRYPHSRRGSPSKAESASATGLVRRTDLSRSAAR
jgi:hypothetical protein